MLKELVIASHNRNKIKELTQILSPYGVKVISACDLNLPDVEETGTTFAENAALKAETLSNLCGKPCLADDSGLCIEALNNRPGVYSARYAPDGNYNLAMNMLINELKSLNTLDWSAHFSCVIAVKEPSQPTRLYQGITQGRIIPEQRGQNGFGYDPIFVPEGLSQTFAELTADQKVAISHRGKAMAAFLQSEFNGRNL